MSDDSKANYPPLAPASSPEDSMSQSQTQKRPPKAPAAATPQPKSKSKQKPKEAKPERRKGEDRRKPSAPAPVRDSEAELGGGLRPQDVLAMLVEDPSLIEPGLEVYTEDGEAIGVGYSTAVGDIDLLARDDAGAWVIILVVAPDRSKELVSELLQRIGWVRRHLGSSEEEVRGIVLLDELPDDLGYAAAAVSDTVEFKLYRFQLSFEPVIL